MNIVEQDRRGRFFIAKEIMINNPAECIQILSDVLVINARYAHPEKIQYIGYSIHFDALHDELLRPEFIPTYECQITAKEDNEYIVNWVRE